MRNAMIARETGGGRGPLFKAHFKERVILNNSIENGGCIKKGFTLAEVLITLGIIGIVAALTMPTLIQKHNNKVVETRLMKFYSAINQAVKMAEVDYGDKKIWWQDLSGALIDNEGNPIAGSSESEKWFNKYLAPYLKIVKQETLSDGTFIVYFADGGALRPASKTTRDWHFYPGKPQKCIEMYGDNGGKGICVFTFNLMPQVYGKHLVENWKYIQNKGFEPFKYHWDGTEEQLKTMCYTGVCGFDAFVSGTEYCATLIQYNGWKIPDDYPHKVKY